MVVSDRHIKKYWQQTRIMISSDQLRDKQPVKQCAMSRNSNKSMKSIGKTEHSIKKQSMNSGPFKNIVNKDRKSSQTYEMSVKRCETLINDYNQNVISVEAFEDLNAIIQDIEKQISIKIPQVENEYTISMSKEDTHMQVIPEKDMSKSKCGTVGISSDDILSYLGQLEEGSMDELARIAPAIDGSMKEISNKDLRIVYSDSNSQENIRKEHVFKEDLAVANLQLEEKNATISMLKDELRSERKLACEKLEVQRKSHTAKLHTQEEKYKGIVKRHQKFIEQLISEKKDLSEKCDALATHVKEMEARFQRDLKATVERHAVELQRAKEHCAAAEKVRRERWVETRTMKIKEMTVKGLEPELRNMIEQHEEELQKLRNAHMQELQDTELRLVRQSNQQLEQLRLELTASHEKMLANEKQLLWARYKENVEEREVEFHEERKRLLDDVKKEKSLLFDERAKLESEREKSLQDARIRFEGEIEEVKRQYAIDKKSMENRLRSECEMRLADCKRQQHVKLEKSEARIREECNRERDRQIEVAIERLEEESRQTESSLRQSFENKIKSSTEKYDMDMQTMIESEKVQKEKSRILREKFDEAEVKLGEMEKRLTEYTSDLNSARSVIKQLAEDRDSARKIARQEIEVEKRELEEKIASLYQEINQSNVDRETWMAQLHSRIKLVMTQKILIIRNLTKELNLARSRCEHLEALLDQQRREFILRTLE